MAIFDQGLISGSNFFLGIVLARWLGAEQYGAYALAFSTFLLVSLIYQALLLEPMSVFGSSTYRGSVRQYLGGLLWLQAAIAAVFVALGTTASVVHYHGRPALQFAFIGMTGDAVGVKCGRTADEAAEFLDGGDECIDLQGSASFEILQH